MVRLQLNQPELNERLVEGYYTIKSTQALGKIAFNLNRNESQTELLTAEAIENQFEAAGFSDIKVQAMSSGNSSFELEMEKPNSFWRTFVLLAMLFLLIEMALLKFWKS